MKCSKCGTINHGTNFCVNCFFPLDDSNSIEEEQIEYLDDESLDLYNDTVNKDDVLNDVTSVYSKVLPAGQTLENLNNEVNVSSSDLNNFDLSNSQVLTNNVKSDVILNSNSDVQLNVTSNNEVNVQSNDTLNSKVNISQEGDSNVQSNNKDDVEDVDIRWAIKKDAKGRKKAPIIIGMIVTSILSFLITFLIVSFLVTPFLMSSSIIGLASSFNLILILFVAEILNAIIVFLLAQVVIKISLEVSRGSNITVFGAISYVFKHFGRNLKLYLLLIVFVIVIVLIFSTLSNLVDPVIAIFIPLVIVLYFIPVLVLYSIMAVDDVNYNKLKIGMLDKCMELARGHRTEYYGLIISFIGWFLLIPFTFGILSFWVMPYLQISVSNWYRYLNKEVSYSKVSS